MKMLCLGVKSRWGFNVSKELQSRDGCRVCAEGQKVCMVTWRYTHMGCTWALWGQCQVGNELHDEEHKC